MNPCPEAQQIIAGLRNPAATPEETRALIAARCWHLRECPACNPPSLAEVLFGVEVAK